MTALLWIFAAYLIGSISFAIVLSKLFNMDDPRHYGSNNPGATNMLRSGHKTIALLTLLGDGLKGFLPVYCAKQFTDLPAAPLALIALAAFIGHLYPIYFQFKGGKGVATFLGTILALSPLVGAYTLLTWLLVAFFTRYSSLSSLTASMVTLPLFLFVAHWDWGNWIMGVVAMIALLFWRHRNNMTKLRMGNESKLFTST